MMINELMDKELEVEVGAGIKGKYSICYNAACMKDDCNLHAHSLLAESNNLIFQMHQCHCISCFEIAHHELLGFTDLKSLFLK